MRAQSVQGNAEIFAEFSNRHYSALNATDRIELRRLHRRIDAEEEPDDRAENKSQDRHPRLHRTQEIP